MRRYERSDYQELATWFKGHDMDVPDESFLPELGFIVEGVACGFLIRSEIPIATIDIYVTNPKAKREEYLKALEQITLGLIDEAKRLKVSKLMCTSKLPSIRLMAKRNGFLCMGDSTLFVRGL